jgi:hypothetical protein
MACALVVLLDVWWRVLSALVAPAHAGLFAATPPVHITAACAETVWLASCVVVVVVGKVWTSNAAVSYALLCLCQHVGLACGHVLARRLP